MKREINKEEFKGVR